jgi:type IV secretion system protein VirB1
MEFVDLVKQCAPMVHVQTMTSLVKVESSFNPYNIGVVDGRLARAPRTREEAIATAYNLEKLGYNWSAGYAQVNKKNFKRLGLTIETAFDGCKNLAAGGTILAECFAGALKKFPDQQSALRGAFSCYYSGNYQTGFRPDFKGQPSYVDKIVGTATGTVDRAIPVVRANPAPKERTSGRTVRQIVDVDGSVSALVY